VEKGTQTAPCILKIYCILYFKLYFYIFINVHRSRLFSNPVTHRGFAGTLLQLEWLQTSLIISGFSHLFCHLEGQRYEAFYCKKHHHNCDVINNQPFPLYCHEDNDLVTLIHLINGFVYKHPYCWPHRLTSGSSHGYKLIILRHLQSLYYISLIITYKSCIHEWIFLQ